MAMLNCPECRKKISDTATACPKCGATLTAETIQQQRQKQADQGKFASIGCGILMLMLIAPCIVGALFGARSEPKSPEEIRMQVLEMRALDHEYSKGIMSRAEWLRQAKRIQN